LAVFLATFFSFKKWPNPPQKYPKSVYFYSLFFFKARSFRFNVTNDVYFYEMVKLTKIVSKFTQNLIYQAVISSGGPCQCKIGKGQI